MVQRSEARRLFGQLDKHLIELGNRLFETTEGEYLGVDPVAAARAIPGLIRLVGDNLSALANLDVIAHGFREEVLETVRRSLKDPFDLVEMDPNDWFLGPDEGHLVMVELPDLARRMRAIYGLEEGSGALAPFEQSQKMLVQVAKAVGATITHLIEQKLMQPPQREDHVKHVMYATVASVFPGTLPDGKINFPRVLKSYEPDLSVPRLKTCVELKIARNRRALAEVLGQVTVDMSAYGSQDYTSFVSIIYTDNEALTQKDVDNAISEKLQILGAEPRYSWGVYLALGPLAPAKSRAPLVGV